MALFFRYFYLHGCNLNSWSNKLVDVQKKLSPKQEQMSCRNYIINVWHYQSDRLPGIMRAISVNFEPDQHPMTTFIRFSYQAAASKVSQLSQNLFISFPQTKRKKETSIPFASRCNIKRNYIKYWRQPTHILYMKIIDIKLEVMLSKASKWIFSLFVLLYWLECWRSFYYWWESFIPLFARARRASRANDIPTRDTCRTTQWWSFAWVVHLLLWTTNK